MHDKGCYHTLISQLRAPGELDIARIAGTYQAWRGEKGTGKDNEIPGFCKSAIIDKITVQCFVYAPSRFVGTEDVTDNDEPLGEKMLHHTVKFQVQFANSAKLGLVIRSNLKELGYDG